MTGQPKKKTKAAAKKGAKKAVAKEPQTEESVAQTEADVQEKTAEDASFDEHSQDANVDDSSEAPASDASMADAETFIDDGQTEVNYTAAQLRLARRKARRLGLNPNTGKEAIAMLMERGIAIDDAHPVGAVSNSDNMQITGASTKQPSPPANGQTTAAAAAASNPLMQAQKAENLPASQVIGQQNQLPVVTKEQRQLEIAKLEKKIRNRRETRMRRLMRRFSLFVFVPTILIAIYYFFIATPQYEANTVLNIENATSRATGFGDIMKNTPFGGGGEYTAVQDYLLSRSAFERLQEEYPFVQLYETDEVDRFLRISPDADLEEQYKLYRRQVKVKYDNTDQKLVMDVRSPDQQAALDISELLLSFAEERVDDKTQRVRDTGVQDAEQLLEEKAKDLETAEAEINRINEMNETLGAATEQSELQALVAETRGQLTQNKIALQQLEANPNPNQSRIRGLKEQIKVLETTINDLTQQGLEVNEQGTSVARLAQEMRIAETRLAMATNQFEQASINLQNAEAEARSQRMFVTPTLPPTVSFEPVFPRKFLSTFSAFIIFFALYILVSMTIEVIREQISA